jgi:hypothetical protein
MKLNSLLTALVCFAATLSVATAADLAGKWTSEFESQIGPQKYAYEFKGEGAALTGKATYDHSMGKGEVELKDIKVEGENVSFVESVHVPDGDLRITYKGKLNGDEMKLTRVVGDFGTEEIIAKRVKS